MNTNLFALGGIGEKFVQSRFEGFSAFEQLKQHFESKGLTFIYERSQIFLGLNADNKDNGDAQASLPFALGVVPTFKPFNVAGTPSHIAASIVGHVTNGTATFIGTEVLVNHDPLEVQSYKVVEIDLAGQIQETEVSRGSLNSMTPEQIAASMGAPSVDESKWDKTQATTNIADTATLASMAINNIINDQYSSPMYPVGGVQTLLNDSTLANKFSLAVRERYSLAVRDILVCTSTSTSCNGCTSSSTSCIKIPVGADS